MVPVQLLGECYGSGFQALTWKNSTKKKTKNGTEMARQMLKTVAESCVTVNAMVVFIGAITAPTKYLFF
jgi:uncharacterized membrane protein